MLVRHSRRCGGTAHQWTELWNTDINFRTRRMDQRARTITVLACLVGAMTGAATLLAWMDPSIPPPPEPLSQPQLVSLAHSLVNNAVVIDPELWDQVEVVAGPRTPHTGTWLAARSENSQSHFFIDDTGRPSRASRWCAQRQSEVHPHAIRIRVTPPVIGPYMSTAQLLCLRALVDALDGAVSPGSTPLRVDFEPELLHGGQAAESVASDSSRVDRHTG